MWHLPLWSQLGSEAEVVVAAQLIAWRCPEGCQQQPCRGFFLWKLLEKLAGRLKQPQGALQGADPQTPLSLWT